MSWDLADYLFAAVLLLGIGTCFAVAVRRSGSRFHRVGIAVALGAALLLVWVNEAVGLVGSEDHPANRMYYGVLAIGFVGALLARLRPPVMAWVMLAVATAHLLAGVAAQLSGAGSAWVATLLFTPLWLGAAWLFRRAARQA
jgi:hypothetical protein